MPTLNWIGKEAVVGHHKEVPFRLLEEDEKLSVGDSESGNLVIEGDNLEALKALLPHYKGKIKCIYIDPPYNTGNENWIYNDNVNSPKMKEWLGSVVGKEDLNRHDKWLCMMYPRLVLLRELLSEDGVIFVSIGEDEISSLKFLLNEIFKQNNLLENFIWINDGHNENQEIINTKHEYVLLFSKKKEKTVINSVIDPNISADSKIRRSYAENSITKNTPKNPASIITLPIGFPCETKELYLEKYENFIQFKDEVIENGFISRELTKKFNVTYPLRRDDLLVKQGKLIKPCSVFTGWSSLNKLKKFIKNNCKPYEDGETKLSFFLSKNGVIYYRRDGRVGHHVSSILRNLGTTEKNRYFLEKLRIEFQYPKPIELVEYLISFFSKKDSIILDSFAGSGTTGHSVLQLNKEDGGNRKFILIEMEQEIAQNVTAKRLEKVIEGYEVKKNNGKTEKVEGLGSGFNFYKLGKTLFDGNGKIRETVTFEELARHIFFLETKTPLTEKPTSPLIGQTEDLAVYLLYNGILKDKKPNNGNVLTTQVLADLPKFEGQKIIYGTSCRLSKQRLENYKIKFKQIPYDVGIS